jgi:uncharacterized protein involved in exopolysaccharide biosynthesis
MIHLEPTIGTVLAAGWRHKYLVVGSILATFALAVAAYLKTTPTFEASTSLLVGQDRSDDTAGVLLPTEVLNSQARIADSDSVVRVAIQHVGLDRIPEAQPGPMSGLGGKLRGMVKQWLQPEMVSGASMGAPITAMDLAVERVRRSMTARAEPNTSVLTIAFHHENPTLAAEMTNALAEAFIDQQNSLLRRPGLIEFLRVQTQRFDDEVRRASQELQDFMHREGMYSSEEQRSLLLRRASELDADLSRTRSSLAQAEGQKHALSRQLALLDPVARSPFASGFVERLDADDIMGREADAEAALPLRDDDTPPLLMIKVFQEAMTAYRILDSEVAGLRDLATQQAREVEEVDRELARVTSIQGEYERLRREVDLATFNAETFAKRTVAEQIESDLRDARLSNVRVIQPATTPRQAVSPKGVVYAGFGLAFGLILGMALALAKEFYNINRRDGARRT